VYCPGKSRLAKSFVYQILLVPLLLLIAGCETQTTGGVSPNSIGIVTRSVGYPEVLRKQRTYILASQSRLYAEDVIQTDKNSRLKITMNDGTTFALGPNSDFVIHRYEYDVQLNTPVAQMTFTRGSVRTKTAKIMEATEPKFEIRTPLAVIGVRGTDFWSGFLFGKKTLDVAMIKGKGIYVENELGSVDLYQDGWGTTVIDGSAPQAPKPWSNQKVNRTLTETNL
jgi:hypothetical protein